QRDDEARGFLDRTRWRAAAAAMAWQIECEHVPAVVREPAALQNPDAVVVQHAVDEHHGRLCRVEVLAAGVAVGGMAVDMKLHHAPAFTSAFASGFSPAFSAAFSARFRSSIRSSGSSSPID